MGSPLYRLAALPKMPLAQLLLLSSEKKTTGCLFGKKWGKDVGRGETYEDEKRLSLRLEQGLGLPKCWEHWTQDLSSDPVLMLRNATQSASPMQCHSFSLGCVADNRFIGLHNITRIRYDSSRPQSV